MNQPADAPLVSTSKTDLLVPVVASIVLVAVLVFQSILILRLTSNAKQDALFRADVRALILCGNDRTCIESVVNQIRERNQPATSGTSTTTTTATTVARTGAIAPSSSFVSTPSTAGRGPPGPAGPQGPAGSTPSTTAAPAPTTTTTAVLPRPPPITIPCVKGIIC